MASPRYRIVVGITGGIAAYKAVSLIRLFVQDGHHVDVVATESALEFIGRPTLEAISRNPVHTGLYDDVAQVRHVALGQQADIIVVAPATANFLAQTAAGLAPDLLSNTILARRCPLVVAPAMHTEMWLNPLTVRNIETLQNMGVSVVGPGVGPLTGLDEGPGRMAEVEHIRDEVYALLAQAPSRSATSPAGRSTAQGDLAGQYVVISGGGTREHIDPVRFIGNESSGKQAVALAIRALDRGARVTLVHAHIDVEVPPGVESVAVESADELDNELQHLLPDADILIMAAAVSDYRPVSVATSKLKKEDLGKTLTVNLVENPDILAGLVQSRARLARKPIIVGFAAETSTTSEELVERGRAKLVRKGCDLLVLNSVSDRQTFGSENNSVVILDPQGDIVVTSQGSKMSVADTILDSIINALPHQNAASRGN